MCKKFQQFGGHDPTYVGPRNPPLGNVHGQGHNIIMLASVVIMHSVRLTDNISPLKMLHWLPVDRMQGKIQNCYAAFQATYRNIQPS